MKNLFFAAIAIASTMAVNATPVLPGPETPLQTILNNTIVGHSTNVNTDQAVDDEYWVAGTNPAAYLIIEIAGYAGSNTFGIFQNGTPANKVEVFAGSESSLTGPKTVLVPGSWASFGFYLSNNVHGFTWYSDPTLNSGGQQDHFVAYQGKNGSTLNLATSVAYDSNDYILAIEDLNLGDKDYNDMVVLVQNVSPVPDAGATLALLGLSMTGVCALRRKFGRA